MIPTEQVLAVVRQVRGRYPTPIGSNGSLMLAEIYNTLQDRWPEVGLLADRGGVSGVQVNGVAVERDIICLPDGTQYDILGDGEGAATPQCSEPAKYTKDATRYLSAVALGFGMKPPAGDPPQTPSAADHVAELEQRLQADEDAGRAALDDIKAQLEEIRLAVESLRGQVGGAAAKVDAATLQLAELAPKIAEADRLSKKVEAISHRLGVKL